ncbi:MAG: hypothetical protein NVS3B21_08440 [Acidimicrobiales bacterium]
MSAATLASPTTITTIRRRSGLSRPLSCGCTCGATPERRGAFKVTVTARREAAQIAFSAPRLPAVPRRIGVPKGIGRSVVR